MKTFIWKTVACHRVYSIMKDCGKKKIVNIINSSAAMKGYLLSCLIGFWIPRKSTTFQHYGDCFPFHFLLVNLLLGIQVYARYQKSVITSQCLSQHVAVCPKKCLLTIKLLIYWILCQNWRFPNYHSILITQPNLQH